MFPHLGVNIDHIATLRQARKISYPDPVESLPILVRCGVDQVTCHLREDRRHIQDHDLVRIIEAGLLPVNLEIAATEEMTSIACQRKPRTCTLVPEKREEITTEGGLDIVDHFSRLKLLVPVLKVAEIRVSFFIDPDPRQIEASYDLGVDGIELHTGRYCEVFGKSKQDAEFERIKEAARYAKRRGMAVFAGHGLNWLNLKPLTQIREIEEYNIGHSIIARAVFLGLEGAVREITGILSGTEGVKQKSG